MKKAQLVAWDHDGHPIALVAQGIERRFPNTG